MKPQPTMANGLQSLAHQTGQRLAEEDLARDADAALRTAEDMSLTAVPKHGVDLMAFKLGYCHKVLTTYRPELGYCQKALDKPFDVLADNGAYNKNNPQNLISYSRALRNGGCTLKSILGLEIGDFREKVANARGRADAYLEAAKNGYTPIKTYHNNQTAKPFAVAWADKEGLEKMQAYCGAEGFKLEVIYDFSHIYG